jgi:hypothetical protein
MRKEKRGYYSNCDDIYSPIYPSFLRKTDRMIRGTARDTPREYEQDREDQPRIRGLGEMALF